MLEEMFPTLAHRRGVEQERDTGFDIGM